MTQQKTRPLVYFFVGLSVTIFNFVLYTLIARFIIKNPDLLWLSNLIATVFTAIVAYFAHSRITWKDREVTTKNIINFFLWNALLAIIITPVLTKLFSLFTPLYEFAFQISEALSLPFDYEFVQSTGTFGFTGAVIMVINYLFYDRVVFGNNKPPLSQNSQVLTQNPKVSIIVPIYNTAKYLKTCLNSIVGQTYQNLEIILVDDGSTDNSLEICKKYAKKDKRIRILHQKNHGQSSARNQGLKRANGKFVSFVDSDDEIDKDFIKELLLLYQSDPQYQSLQKTSRPKSAVSTSKIMPTALTVCGHKYRRLKEQTEKRLYISPLRPRRPKENPKLYVLKLLTRDGRLYSCNNKLFISSIAKDLRFDTKLNFAEDTKFVLDYLEKAPGEIRYTPASLYIYNYGTDTSTIKKSALNWHNWQTSYKNLKTWVGKNPSVSERFWLALILLRWKISYFRSRKRVKKI